MVEITFDEEKKVWFVQLNPNVRIGLSELSEEALEKLLSDPMLSLFLPHDSKDIVRAQFKEILEKVEK